MGCRQGRSLVCVCVEQVFVLHVTVQAIAVLGCPRCRDVSVCWNVCSTGRGVPSPPSPPKAFYSPGFDYIVNVL